MISTIWAHSWQVGQLISSDIGVSGSVGPFVWTLQGPGSQNLKVTLLQARGDRIRISGSMPQGTYPIAISVTDASTGQSLTAGPYDVVVGARLDALNPTRSATAGQPYSLTVSVAGGNPLADCVTISPPVLECEPASDASGTKWTLRTTASPSTSVMVDLRIPTDTGVAFLKYPFVLRPLPALLAPVVRTPTGKCYVVQECSVIVAVQDETGSEPFRFQITSGYLPPGMRVQSAPTSSSVVTIFGFPSVAGTYEFTVTVTDVWSGTGSVSIRTVIEDPYQFTIGGGNSPPRGTVGKPFGYVIPRQNERWYPNWTVIAGALPLGLELQPATGAIYGTPAVAGSTTVKVQAAIELAFPVITTSEFTLVIDPAPGPVITVPYVLPSAALGQFYETTLPVIGGTPPYRFTNTTPLVPGLTLSENGKIPGTATATTPYTFFVRVTDNVNSFYEASYQILVQTTNDPIELPEGRVGRLYGNPSLEQFLRPLSLDRGYVRGTLPDGLYLDNNSEYVTGTPRKEGTWEFEFGQGPPSGGAHRKLRLHIQPSTGLHSYAISDQASIVFSTAGDASSPMIKTYGRLQPELVFGTPDSYQLVPSAAAFIQYRHDGVLISETTVQAAEPVFEGRTFAEVSDAVNTGLAIVNQRAQASDVMLYYQDSKGVLLRTVRITVPASSQLSAFLNEPPFNAPFPFKGTVTFNAGSSIAVTALRGLTNERSDFLLTTLPMISSQANVGTLVVPQFAAGGGWITHLVLVNPVGETLRGHVQFVSPGSVSTAAEVVEMIVNGTPTNSFSYEIPGGGIQELMVSISGDAPHVGSVHVIPDGTPSPSGTLMYSYKPNGITLSQTGLPLAAAGRSFRLFAERNINPNTETGIALANPSNVPVTVDLTLFSMSGSVTGRSVLALPAKGQTAFYLNELDELKMPASSQGILEVTSRSSGITLSGLRGHYNERGEYVQTSIPAVEANSGSSANEKLFPHLVDGGEYRVQIVLFSGGPRQSGDGYLKMFTIDGKLIEILRRP